MSSINPPTPTVVNGNQYIQVNGTNFQPNLKVNAYNSAGGLMGTLQGAAQIMNLGPTSFTMYINLGATPGSFSVAVVNPNSAASNRFSFSTQWALFSPPSLLAPNSGATNVATLPTFSWSGVSGAKKYWLMVATSSGGLPNNVNAVNCPSCVISTNLTTTTYAPTAALANGTLYYWQVQAYDNTVSPTRQGQFSLQAWFTTQATPTATPTFNPGSGSYLSAQSVSISDSTASPTIYYTTNGTTPSTSSTRYTGPITVSSTTTIQAIATASGHTQSAVGRATYSIVPPVSAPTVSPGAGTYNDSVTQVLSSATPNAIIRYTTNGADPTASSPPYGGSFKLTTSTTIKARAFKSGMSDSAISSAYVQIVVPTPVASPAPGAYAGPLTVILSQPNTSTVRCTQNGAPPTATSPVVAPSVALVGNTNLQCAAFRDGATPSPSWSKVYGVRPATKVVYLLIHGLNSTPATWASMSDYFKKQGISCEQVSAQTSAGSLKAASCYIMSFSSATSGGQTWDNGDGLTFAQLGSEVLAAVVSIDVVNAPSAIILIGHSRGGLAARAFMQKVGCSTPRLVLITLDTPHLGSPLGRAKWFLDANGITLSNVANYWYLTPNYNPRVQLKFVFSPSTGDLATSYDAKGNEISDSYSKAIMDLKSGVGQLSQVTTAAGDMYSTSLTLGTYTSNGSNLMSDSVYQYFDQQSKAKLENGNANYLRDFVVKNLPALWLSDGDGIVPTDSQKLDSLTGTFSSSIHVSSTLTKVLHADVTGQTDSIWALTSATMKKGGLSNTGSLGSCAASFSPLSSGNLPAVQVQRSERSTRAILQRWQTARLRSDEVMLAASEEAFREFVIAGDRAGLAELRGSLRGLDDASKQRWISLLARTPVPEALDMLLNWQALTSANAMELGAVDDAIMTLGAMASMQQPSETADPDTRAAETAAILANSSGLSTMLRPIVEAGDTSDMARLEAVVSATAALGDPETFKVILSLIQRLGPKPIGGPESPSSMLLEAARRVRSVAVLPILEHYLIVDPDLTQAMTPLIGEIMASMGQPEATAALLKWSSGVVGDSESVIALDWISRMRDPDSLDVVEEALTRLEFRNATLHSQLSAFARQRRLERPR